MKISQKQLKKDLPKLPKVSPKTNNTVVRKWIMNIQYTRRHQNMIKFISMKLLTTLFTLLYNLLLTSISSLTLVLPSVKDEWWNKVSLDDFSTKISGSIATVTKAFVFFWFFSWFLVSTISFHHSFSFLLARALAADAFVLSKNPNARSWEANLVVWRLLWWLQSVEGGWLWKWEWEREKRSAWRDCANAS